MSQLPAACPKCESLLSAYGRVCFQCEKRKKPHWSKNTPPKPGKNAHNSSEKFFPICFVMMRSRPIRNTWLMPVSLFLPKLLHIGEHGLDLVVSQLVLERRHLPFAAFD